MQLSHQRTAGCILSTDSDGHTYSTHTHTHTHAVAYLMSSLLGILQAQTNTGHAHGPVCAHWSVLLLAIGECPCYANCVIKHCQIL